LLDEESIFPKGTDESLLDKLHKTCSNHKFFEKPTDVSAKSCFAVRHYAGKVSYTINGFLDKNKDTLFNNIRAMLENSNNPFVKKLFPYDSVQDSKRPPTSVAQFKVKKLFSL
jgi:myosin heavy subunit